MIVNCSNPTCGAFTYVTAEEHLIVQLDEIGWDVRRDPSDHWGDPEPYCPRCLS